MSLNGAQLDRDRRPILIQGEKLFLTQSGVRMDYESGEGYPGQGNNYFIQDGTLFLTNIRVIYVPKEGSLFLENLNVPLENLK
jgi:hypothetical protein